MTHKELLSPPPLWSYVRMLNISNHGMASPWLSHFSFIIQWVLIYLADNLGRIIHTLSQAALLWQGIYEE